MKLTLGGSILVASLICGTAFSPEAIGQVTRVRTGPQGNQSTTDWTRGNGQELGCVLVLKEISLLLIGLSKSDKSIDVEAGQKLTVSRSETMEEWRFRPRLFPSKSAIAQCQASPSRRASLQKTAIF